ncbi:Na(+)-translocating NADH-quinone reductase subunit A [Bacteriovoracaceae bacterium]|nr:Na(+)-translocating NADH-quinone reductase subunit A [Bacteriovoracaceae bacterium]
MIKIKQGLDLPISGEVKDTTLIVESFPREIAVLGRDFVGMKPTMLVGVGDSVKSGQHLFQDKKNPDVFFSSPVSGKVKEINRGERRAFRSIVIELNAKSFLDLEGDSTVSFKNYKNSTEGLSSEDVKNLLIESGLWSFIRKRPYSKVANPNEAPNALFINAMDTHPLSLDPTQVIEKDMENFKVGAKALSALVGETNKYLCHHENLNFDGNSFEGFQTQAFKGPHPAGLSGTHIHKLNRVGFKKHAWYVDYSGVIEIGHLFSTGKINPVQFISVAGPMCRRPSVYKTLRGANLYDLTNDLKFSSESTRVISGSVFGGRAIADGEQFLGQFHHQVTMMRESEEREFLGWHSPGINKFSVKPIYLSKLIPKKKFWFDTNTNGSHRSIVPIGSFEKVFPIDTEPTYLCRSIMSGNADLGYQLGALELDEEDVCLLSYVDPCKNDYAANLRELLIKIEKEN